MKIFIALFMCFVLVTSAHSQTGPKLQPSTPSVLKDTSQTVAPPHLPTNGSLPPSIESELRRAQLARAARHRDSLATPNHRALAIRDTLHPSSLDSTQPLHDTLVALPHHEWLDSELVEIPELTRFGSSVHYNYPQSIMVETDVHAVPFDSSLVSGMNPISRENLPFFDQSPIPLPLTHAGPLEAFLEAGGGTIYQPFGAAWLAYTFSPRTSLEVNADYRSLATVPLHNFLNLSGAFDAQIGEDPGSALFHSSDLTLRMGYAGKSLSIPSDSGFATASLDHRVSQFQAEASLVGDGSDRFHYELSGKDIEFKDDLGATLKESSQAIHGMFHFDPYISHFRLIGEASYDHAGLTSLTSTARALIALSDPLSSYSLKGLFGRRKGEAIEWYVGAELLGGALSTDVSNETYTSLSPVARVRFPLNPRWEFGASYEPAVQLASQALLSNINPFFSPFAAMSLVNRVSTLSTTDSVQFDARSVVIDKINLSAFMNYMLSPDDEVRLVARFITRQHEPVFEQHTLRDSSTVFAVTPQDTRRFEFAFNGNFLLLTRDVLTAAVDVSSATIVGTDSQLPFEPSMKFQAAYHFNSFSETIRPAIEFRSIARKDRNLSFLNAEVRVQMLRQLSILVRAENILGGPDDFWTGFAEYPRSIWASARYSF